MRRVAQFAAILLSLMALPVSAQTTSEPRPTPGRDPGGVAVAIVGRGIDYNDPGLSPRLARDGEGELIGWDFTDNDPRPYATGDPLAAALAAAAPAARLIAVKVDLAKDQPHASAIGFLRATPARIVLLDTAVPFAADWAIIVRAASLTPQFLYVLAATSADGNADRPSPPDAAPIPANVLIVAALAHNTGSPPPLPPEREAAVRATAVAANLLAREPATDGAALKARILDEVRKTDEAARGWRIFPSTALPATQQR